MCQRASTVSTICCNAGWDRPSRSRRISSISSSAPSTPALPLRKTDTLDEPQDAVDACLGATASDIVVGFERGERTTELVALDEHPGPGQIGVEYTKVVVNGQGVRGCQRVLSLTVGFAQETPTQGDASGHGRLQQQTGHFVTPQATGEDSLGLVRRVDEQIGSGQVHWEPGSRDAKVYTAIQLRQSAPTRHDHLVSCADDCEVIESHRVKHGDIPGRRLGVVGHAQRSALLPRQSFVDAA